MNKIYYFFLLLFYMLGTVNLQAQQQVALPAAPEAEAMKEYVDVPVNMYTGIPDISIPIYHLQGREIGVPITLSYHAGGVRVAEEAGWVGLGWSLSAGGMITREIRDNDDFGEINFWDGGAERSLPYQTTLGLLPKDPANPGSNQFSIHDDLETSALLENCAGPLSLEPCSYETNSGATGTKLDFCGELYSNLGHASSSLSIHNRIDTEPDLFTFSFGGYSGKFVYDRNTQQYVPMSGQAISIEMPSTNLQEPYWIVTTPDGKKYFFGDTANGRQLHYNVSNTINSSGRSGDNLSESTCTSCFNDPSELQKRSYISTWYLQRIEAPNGDVVFLDYEKDPVIFDTGFAAANQSGIRPVPNYSDYMEDRLMTCQEFISSSFGCLSPPLPQGEENLNRTITRTAYDRVTLTAIRSEYGKVEFTTSADRADLLGAVRLNSIDIYSGSGAGNLFKKFVLEYSYFDSSNKSQAGGSNWTYFIKPTYWRALPGNFNSGHFNKRLKLESIQEFGADGGTSIPPHKFTYFEGYNAAVGADQTLPPKSSFAIDIWGYHNNVQSNRLLIPDLRIDPGRLQALYTEFDQTFPCTSAGMKLPIFQGANRETSADHAGGWLLKTVEYPTKGKLEMAYEANEYAIPPTWKKKPQGNQAFVGIDQNTLDFVWENTFTVSTDRPNASAPFDATVYVGYVLQFDEDDLCSPCAIGDLENGSRKLPYVKITPTDGSSPPQFVNGSDMLVGDPHHSIPLCTDGGADECSYGGPMISKTISLVPGKSYEIELYVIDPCGYRQVPCDLAEFQVSVVWDEYELIDRQHGGGMRISRSELEDGRGHTITKLYKYPLTNSQGQAQAKLLNEPRFEYEYFTLYAGGTFCNGSLPYVSTLESHRYSNSQVPLQSGYAGSFVGYSEVEVWHGEGKENGRSRYVFYNEPTNYSFGIHAEPPNYTRFYDQRNGSLLEQFDYLGDTDDPVRRVVNEYANQFLETIWSFSLFTFLNPSSWGGIAPDKIECFENRNQFYFYKDVRQWVKLLKTEETLYFYENDGSEDGKVIKTTDYTYNNENLQIATTSLTDSDGRVYTTKYDYPVGSSLTEDNLIASAVVLNEFNMQSTVMAERKIVDGQQVGGSKTTFKKINVDGDLLIVPDTLFQWEGVGTDAWDPIGTFTAYYADAFPKTFQKAYYADPDEFEWFGYGADGPPQLKGLLAKKTYKDFEWAFDYQANNRKLAQKTEPDGTFSLFTYDPLQRLRTATSHGNSGTAKSTTTINYLYGEPGSDGNNVTARIDYHDGTPSKESVKYYDGLGRYYKTLTKGYFEDAVDVVTDERQFDNFGRVDQQTFLIGNNKTLEYESSPLNRLLKEILPDGHTLQYTYGSEMPDPASDADLYYTQTVSETVMENYLGNSTDKGLSTKTVTDKLGRTYKIVNALDKPTIYHYDDYGNIDLITTPKESTYIYTYDNENRLQTKTIPGAGVITYDYVSDGRDLLQSQTDGEGIQISMEYDIYDRITKTYLGGVGGNRLVENIYYTKAEGHVDKIKQSINQILWQEAAADTKDTYQYDEFGRIQTYTFEHIAGEDITSNTINYADQLQHMQLDHTGYTPVKVDVWNTFDRYDRSKSVEHQIGSYGRISLCDNMTYNTRGQLLTKIIGDGLFTYDYQYSGARGWLEQINEEINSDLILPTCEFEAPEEVVPPLDVTPITHVDELPFYELLKLRFKASLSFAGQPKSCPVIPCTLPGTPCSSGAAAQNILDIQEALRQTVSVQREVPCADGTTEIIDVISTDPIFLPTNLYRVRFCDGSEAYVLAAYLDQVTGDYEIVQDLRVNEPTQTFRVQIGGRTLVYNFSELLGLMIAGTQITVGNYTPCGVPNCNPEPNCSRGEVAAQQAALRLLQENLEQIDAYELIYPVELYAVELCNSQVVYVLESEMELLEQTSIMVVDTIIFNGPEESKPIKSSTPEKNLGPGGLFHMKFAYQPNGNIDELYWQMAGRALSQYDMSYDPLNRMTNAQYAEYFNNGSQRTPANAYGVNGIGYDADGNIEALKRRGLTGYCENGLPEYGPIDDLAYTYHGTIPNRLVGVSDAAHAEKGFVAGGDGSYEHDGAGNLIADNNKGLSIQYNHLNLPKAITGNGGSIQIIYDAAGRKLRKIVTSPDGNYTLDYISGIEFRDGVLEAVYHQEGRFFVPKAEEGQEAEDPRHEFFLKDHLGNTRLVIADRDGSGGIDITEDPATNELLQENHYYPFGMNQEGPWAQPFVLDDQGEITLDADGKPVVDQVRLAKYQYNGKELNGDLGLNWLDYGARWYDPSIGRWNAVDPLAESYSSLSPYNYSFNNPIRFIDPDGRGPDDTIFFDEDGNELYRTKDNLDDAIVVVGKENEAQFHQTRMLASLSPNHVDEGEIKQLRSLGDNYMVDGLEQLYGMTENSATTTDHAFVAADSDESVPLHVEYAAALKTEGNEISVDLSTAEPGSVANTPLKHENSAHTHPDHPAGVRIKSGSLISPGSFDKSPSFPDLTNKASRQKRFGTNKYDAVIGKENIYLFRRNPSGIGGTQQITAPRKFFK